MKSKDCSSTTYSETFAFSSGDLLPRLVEMFVRSYMVVFFLVLWFFVDTYFNIGQYSVNVEKEYRKTKTIYLMPQYPQIYTVPMTFCCVFTITCIIRKNKFFSGIKNIYIYS